MTVPSSQSNDPRFTPARLLWSIGYDERPPIPSFDIFSESCSKDRRMGLLELGSRHPASGVPSTFSRCRSRNISTKSRGTSWQESERRKIYGCRNTSRPSGGITNVDVVGGLLDRCNVGLLTVLKVRRHVESAHTTESRQVLTSTSCKRIIVSRRRYGLRNSSLYRVVHLKTSLGHCESYQTLSLNFLQ